MATYNFEFISLSLKLIPLSEYLSNLNDSDFAIALIEELPDHFTRTIEHVDVSHRLNFCPLTFSHCSLPEVGLHWAWCGFHP